ncbi:aspartyl-phosphate phosphatase Spo0E family protein [Peribacillus sp. NPDC097295]|uniref:aspartyl-phosphate phosphatase Spo0E family protein n=1 Tax=Peribacillus sp. NPDC097295 TaxID=3364402 RepID=UPI0038197FFD
MIKSVKYLKKWEVMILQYPYITVEKIEEKRKEMIMLATNYGFTSRITVQASQELDSLLNAVNPVRYLENALPKNYRE